MKRRFNPAPLSYVHDEITDLPEEELNIEVEEITDNEDKEAYLKKVATYLERDGAMGKLYQRGSRLKTDAVGLLRRLKLYGLDDHLYAADANLWFKWTGKVWQEDVGAVAISDRIREVTQYFYSESKYVMGKKARSARYGWASKKNTLAHAGTILKVLQTNNGPHIANITEFDKEPYYLNTESGVLNILTGEVLEHDPVYKLTKLSPITLDGLDMSRDKTPFEMIEQLKTTAPKFYRALIASFKVDKSKSATYERIHYVMQTLGICLTDDMSPNQFFIWHGQTNSGKTLFHNIMRNILGTYYLEVDSSVFCKGDASNSMTSSSRAKMKGTRMVCVAEFPAGARIAIEFVKAMTGDDLIQGRIMRGNVVEFENTAKIFFRTNNRIHLTEYDAAVTGRLVVVPFPHTCPAERIIPRLDKILIEEEGGAILSYLAYEAATYIKSLNASPKPKNKCMPKDIIDLTKDHVYTDNDFGQFIEQYFEPSADPKHSTLYSQIKPLLKEFWEENSLGKMISKGKVMENFEKAGYKVKKPKNIWQVEGITMSRFVMARHPEPVEDDQPMPEDATRITGLSTN